MYVPEHSIEFINHQYYFEWSPDFLDTGFEHNHITIEIGGSPNT